MCKSILFSLVSDRRISIYYVVTILFFITFYWNKLNAQIVWPSMGARWYYSYFYEFSTGYIEIVYSGDTIINNKTCAILEKIQYGYTYPGVYDTNLLGKEFINYEDGTAYIFKFGKFYTLYDFNAKIGDIWEITGYPNYHLNCDTSGSIIIDSISSVIINGNELKVFYTSPLEDSHWRFTDRIIERIGCTGYLLPISHNCIIDVEEGRDLRCYQDDEFGLYSTGIVQLCNYLTNSIFFKYFDKKINIYPMPFNDYIQLEYTLSNNMDLMDYKILDISGRILKEGIINKNINKLSLIDLPLGIYLFQLIYQNKPIISEIIIKN